MSIPNVVMMNAMAVFEVMTNTLYMTHSAITTAETPDVARLRAWTHEMLLFKGKMEELLEEK